MSRARRRREERSPRRPLQCAALADGGKGGLSVARGARGSPYATGVDRGSLALKTTRCAVEIAASLLGFAILLEIEARSSAPPRVGDATARCLHKHVDRIARQAPRREPRARHPAARRRDGPRIASTTDNTDADAAYAEADRGSTLWRSASRLIAAAPPRAPSCSPSRSLTGAVTILASPRAGDRPARAPTAASASRSTSSGEGVPPGACGPSSALLGCGRRWPRRRVDAVTVRAVSANADGGAGRTRERARRRRRPPFSRRRAARRRRRPAVASCAPRRR